MAENGLAHCMPATMYCLYRKLWIFHARIEYISVFKIYHSNQWGKNPQNLPFPSSNTPIPRPTPIIEIHSAVLPQYTFLTHKQTDRSTDGLGDRPVRIPAYALLYGQRVTRLIIIIIIIIIFGHNTVDYCFCCCCCFQQYSMGSGPNGSGSMSQIGPDASHNTLNGQFIHSQYSCLLSVSFYIIGRFLWHLPALNLHPSKISE